MTHDEMRAKSAEKIQSIQALMKALNVSLRAVDRVDLKTGIIDKAAIFIDNEQYPEDANVGKTTDEKPISLEKSA